MARLIVILSIVRVSGWSYGLSTDKRQGSCQDDGWKRVLGRGHRQVGTLKLLRQAESLGRLQKNDCCSQAVGVGQCTALF